MESSQQMIANYFVLRFFLLMIVVGSLISWFMLKRLLRPTKRRGLVFGRAMDIVAEYEKAIERSGIPLPRFKAGPDPGCEPVPFPDILESHRRRALRLELKRKELPYSRAKIRAAIHACLSEAPSRQMKERLLIGLVYLPSFR